MKLVLTFLLLTTMAFGQSAEIVLATYGSGQLQDVTSTIRSAIASGKRDLAVTLENLGVSDPAPGRVKMLRIVYRANGGLYEVMANDFETIGLPTGVPATTAAATQPQPAQAASVQPTTGGFFDTPGTNTSSAGAAGTPATVTPSTGSVGNSAGVAGGAASAAPAPVTVSPVASVPNGACFYTQANFGGSPYCFASGSSTSTLGDQRRHFRSMRLVGSAKAAWLFDADNFTGASVRLSQSQSNLRAAQGPYYAADFEDRAASLRVE